MKKEVRAFILGEYEKLRLKEVDNALKAGAKANSSRFNFGSYTIRWIRTSLDRLIASYGFFLAEIYRKR